MFRVVVFAGLGVVTWLALAATPAFADLMTFANPTPEYTGTTCKIDAWHALPDGTSVSSISGCGVTITFSSPFQKQSVPAGGWLTWSSPPFSESATPAVLVGGFGFEPTSRTMTFSGEPIDTYGHEAEPDPFDIYSMTLSYATPDPHGSITREVDGDSGARLFAGRTTDATFSSVTFSSDAGWAIAQIRVRTVQQVPDASVLGLMGTGLIAALGAARKRLWLLSA